MMKNVFKTFWERRQTNREIVGKVVTLPIYEDKAETKIPGTFLIIYTDDLMLVGLQLVRLNLEKEFEFPVFNGELTYGEKNFHRQKALNFKNEKNVTGSIRVLNLEALGGIVDVDLRHIHTFKMSTPWTEKLQIDGNSFEDIMHAFMTNPVEPSGQERVVVELYNQYKG
jgi:hypothetical protein